MDTSGTTAPAVRHLSIGDTVVLTGCLLLTVGFLLPPEPAPEPLPDFTEMDTDERKRAFFGFLSPTVAELNEQVRADREHLAEIRGRFDEDGRISWFDGLRLDMLAENYQVETDRDNVADVLETLDRRIGIVPESLVLVQAAKESGWGTSRFAREGNNLFGQRCYRTDCGIVPRNRTSTAKFWIATFETVPDSIASYMLNLNTHPQYRDFRLLRQELREAGEAVTGLALADGLVGYSERGEAYVDEIRDLIEFNGLE